MALTSKLISELTESDLKYQKFNVFLDKGDVAQVHILLVNPQEYVVSPVRSKPTKRISNKRLYEFVNNKHSTGERLSEKLKQFLPLQKVSRVMSKNSDCVYGINGSFFMYYEDLKTEYFTPCAKKSFYGDPIGWFRKDGIDYSFPYLHRKALIVYEDGSIDLKHVSLLDGKLKDTNRNKIIEIDHNHTRDNLSKTVCFYKGRSAVTNIIKYRFSIVGNSITSVNEKGVGNKKIKIPNNGFVVSSPKSYNLKVGDKFEFILNDSTKKVRHAVSTGPTLINNQEFETNEVWEKEDFIDLAPKTLTKDINKYPCARTAIFTLTDNNFGFIVAEGAPTSGLTLRQLALVSKSIVPELNNCVYLDGGGCSTICKREGRTINLLNFPSGVSNQGIVGTRLGNESYIGYSLLVSKK